MAYAELDRLLTCPFFIQE